MALVILAVGAGVLAALLEFTLDPQESLDPHRAAFGTSAAFAAAFCVGALWQLRLVGRGRAGLFGAACCFGLALLALVALIVVAFATRLGG